MKHARNTASVHDSQHNLLESIIDLRGVASISGMAAVQARLIDQKEIRMHHVGWVLRTT